MVGACRGDERIRTRRELRAGTAQVLEFAPIFERALTSILNKLKYENLLPTGGKSNDDAIQRQQSKAAPTSLDVVRSGASGRPFNEESREKSVGSRPIQGLRRRHVPARPLRRRRSGETAPLIVGIGASAGGLEAFKPMTSFTVLRKIVLPRCLPRRVAKAARNSRSLARVKALTWLSPNCGSRCLIMSRRK